MSARGKILIVDDDADFVKSTSDLLAAHGYDVLSAPDGAAGLELARRERPDLMVLDVMMATQTEGFEIARFCANANCFAGKTAEVGFPVGNTERKPAFTHFVDGNSGFRGDLL